MHRDSIRATISAETFFHEENTVSAKATRDLNITGIGLQLRCVKVWILPDIVMALDVDFVKDPFWGLQEILFHLHSYVPGQQTH